MNALKVVIMAQNINTNIMENVMKIVHLDFFMMKMIK